MPLHRTESMPEWLADADLVNDQRAFDVRLVWSVLESYNASIRRDDIGQDSAFEWVPDVLAGRAIAMAMPSLVKPEQARRWHSTTTKSRAAAAFLFLLWGSKLRIEPDGDGYRYTVQPGAQTGLLNQILADLPIYQRFLFSNGKMRTLSVPWVNSMERCYTYAMAVVSANHWGLGEGRVRQCPHVPQGGHAHLFVDYRLDDDGNLARGGPQMFCCHAHANAYRQRAFRRARAKSRKHK